LRINIGPILQSHFKNFSTKNEKSAVFTLLFASIIHSAFFLTFSYLDDGDKDQKPQDLILKR